MSNALRTSTAQHRLDVKNARRSINVSTRSIAACIDMIAALQRMDMVPDDDAYNGTVKDQIVAFYRQIDELERDIADNKRVLRALMNSEANA